MLVAHLPAGFMVGKAVGRFGKPPGLLPGAVAGGVASDFDMLYFHFIDGRQTHHHDYVTHWPLFWLAALLLVLTIRPARPWRWVAVSFCASALVHMVLDSVAAPINWMAPVGNFSVELFPVPSAYGHWVASFLLHRTFGIELIICAIALAVFLRGRRAAE